MFIVTQINTFDLFLKYCQIVWNRFGTIFLKHFCFYFLNGANLFTNKKNTFRVVERCVKFVWIPLKYLNSQFAFMRSTWAYMKRFTLRKCFSKQLQTPILEPHFKQAQLCLNAHCETPSLCVNNEHRTSNSPRKCDHSTKTPKPNQLNDANCFPYTYITYQGERFARQEELISY